jgi:hypothetical protein
MSGGINTFGEFPAVTRGQYVTGAAFFLMQAGFTMIERVKANVSGVVSSNPVDGTTFQFAGEVYTFKTVINNAVQRQVLIGTDIPNSMNHLVAAVNGGGGAGVTYSNATFINPLVTIAQNTVTMVTTVTATARIGGPDGTGISSGFGTLLGGGYLLQGQSPQDRFLDNLPFKFQVYLYDSLHTSGITGHPPQASVRIISAYDGTLKSTEYHSFVGAGVRYRIICCQCQAFIYRPGVDADAAGSVVSFGIPWVPVDKCGTEVQAPPTDEVWWISCDEGGVPNATPRTVVVDQLRVIQGTSPNVSQLPLAAGVTNVNTWLASDACFNGVVVVGPGNNTGHFRMCSLTPPNRWDIVLAESGTVINSMRWFGKNDPVSGLPTFVPMLLEPIVAWANIDNTNPPLARGQMYDSWTRTQQETMDATSDGTDSMETNLVQAGLKFVALTDHSKFGTLWVIVPDLTPVQLEQYQAHYAN